MYDAAEQVDPFTIPTLNVALQMNASILKAISYLGKKEVDDKLSCFPFLWSMFASN